MTDTPALEGMQKIHAQLDDLRTQVAELAKQMATVMSGGSVVLVNAFDATAVTAPPTTYTVEAAEITLQPGEHYAGLVLDATTGAPSYHLILLPGEADDMAWEDARKWAEDHGGTLPTRQEQSLDESDLGLAQFQSQEFETVLKHERGHAAKTAGGP